MMSLTPTKLILIALAAVAVIGGLLFFVTSKLTPQKTTISGSIDYNGTAPAGSTVSVSVRRLGTATFLPITSGLNPSNDTAWSWSDAEQGSAYQLQASLQQNGQTVATSQTISVAAPASGEVLIINSTANPTNDTATISGSVDMNGPVPAGSTIAIGQKLPNETQFNIVQTGLQAVDQVQWTWGGAQSGTLYDIKAFLQVNGANVYESETERVAAPAVNEVLTLNARTPSPTPVPSPQPATISGSINFNGPTPANSSITIVSRISGTRAFQSVAQNVTAANGVNWSWGNAGSGNTYDIQAWVMVNNSVLLQSQILTVTAPAANETLTINNATNQYPAPAANSIYTTCTGVQNGIWQVNVTYNSNNVVQNAQQFLITAGLNSGGNQNINAVTSPSNPNTSQGYQSSYTFNSNQNYYAQYAYSPCTGCGIWSAFSPSYQFACSTPTNTPAPTNSPTPTPTLTITPTPTPTSTPTPTLAPMTSACNETCGSNGYACATGLQCTTGGQPGSQVCRNPNCVMQPDCTCRLLNTQ